MGNRLGIQILVTRLPVMLALAVLTLLAPLMFGQAAQAHKIRPAIIDLALAADGTYHLSIKTNMEALISRIGPGHGDTDDAPQAVEYKALRALPAPELQKRFTSFFPSWRRDIQLEFDGRRVVPELSGTQIPPVGDPALARLSVITLAGTIPQGAKTVRFSLANSGTLILRVKRAGPGEPVTALLKGGAASADLPLSGEVETSLWQIFTDYVGLGYVHILPMGLDHILFVLGLYLLNTHLRPLLIQITAFTLAHSITLGLGLYGVVSVPPAIVEPLIAASIIYVAVENMVTSKLHVWRPVIVFLFGLLHGLGFASVLMEIGLPRSDFVSGLIAFNIGIELGQLSVIAIAFLLTGFWFRHKPWYRTRIVWPLSALIALFGAYWMIERLFLQ